MILEKGQRRENIVRGINEGVAGRFLAMDYMMTGNAESLNYLIDLLDSLIRVGMVDVNSGELHLYDPTAGRSSIDIDVKNSYLLDAFTLGYCLTGNSTYLDVASKTADWLINKNLHVLSGTFPGTSTHDTMEFLEAVWTLYLVSQNKKYFDIVNNCISSYVKMRYRWGGVPFRHFGSNPTFSIDVLTIAQMFLALKIDTWTNDGKIEHIKQLLAYLFSLRFEQSSDESGSRSLVTRLLYKKRGWNWNEKFWQKNDLWNFRYSSLTGNQVYDDWAPKGNIVSFVLSYISLTMLSLRYGCFIGIQGRYFLGQPLVLFSSSKLSEYKSTASTISFRVEGKSKVVVFVPNSSAETLKITASAEYSNQVLSNTSYGTAMQITSSDAADFNFSWQTKSST
jgi:hypothetical protein